MTTENLDIQPALRSPHVSVRAGRLTKFKGRVASIAPGLAVVATAVVLFSGGAAQACSIPMDDNDGGDPGKTVTCRAGNYTHGITRTYQQSDRFTLRLERNHEVTVRGQGVKVEGSGDAGDIYVRMGVQLFDYNHGHLGGTITTNGNDQSISGLSALTTGRSNVHSQLDKGTITTNGRQSYGVWARIDNDKSDATATATMTGGNIYIHGAGSGGLTAHNEGKGNATAHMSGGSIVTDAGHSRGVSAGGRGLVSTNEEEPTEEKPTVKALMTGGVVETKQLGSAGIFAEIQSRGNAFDNGAKINVNAHAELVAGKVTTAHMDSVGVGARVIGNDAEAKALMVNGDIDTSGLRSSGLQANADGTGGQARAELNGSGSILTRGDHGHGIQAFAGNTADASTATATVMMRAGEVKIRGGVSARGMYVQSNGGKGMATAEMHGGSIFTSGYDAHAIYARIDNLEHTNNSDKTNGVRVIMTGGSIVTTNSGSSPNSIFGSHGLHADTTGSADVIVEMEGGTVTTIGRNSHGIFAEFEGVGIEGDDAQAIVNLGAEAEVTAFGAGSAGIRAQGRKSFDVYVAGRVTGGADGLFAEADGVAIRTVSDAEGGGTIDIASTAIVTAGGSGLAIVDGDGAAVVTSAGLIDGDSRLGAGDDKLIVTGGSITDDIHLGTGNDTLELKDGSITGDVYGGAGNDTMNLTGGRFNGDIHTGDGDDSVTIDSKARYDFSYILDGGTGDDELTLHGQTMTSMENVRNWESVTLSETTLRLDGTARLDIDQLSIDAGSAFRASGGGGGITIAGDVINNGSVILDVQDGNTGDVITVEGDYTGSGTSVFALDAALAGNDAETDRLVINGDASGEMMLSVTNLDSAGGEDTPLEIDVVSVGGASEGTFTLVDGNHVTADGEHGVISGAHLYRLAEAEDGRGWVLSAMSESGGRNWQPSAPIYDSYGQSLLALNGPASLRSRGSSEDFRSLAWDGGPADQNRDTPLWFQMGGERITSSEEHSTTGAALESSIWEMEIGADIVVSESGAGLLVGGLMFSYATGSASVSSEFGDGSIDTSGFGLGVAATWYDHRRFYVDGQVSLASYSSDLEADRIGTLTEGNGGTGLAFSIEAGQRFDLGSSLTVIPQAQLSLSSVAFDDFEGERYGEQVTLEDAASQQLRLGLEFGAQEQGAHRLYGIVNLFHEFGAGSEVNVAGATLTTESEPWAVGVGFGGNYALTDRVDLFGEASYATGLSNAGDTSALSANAGLKVVF